MPNEETYNYEWRFVSAILLALAVVIIGAQYMAAPVHAEPAPLHAHHDHDHHDH